MPNVNTLPTNTRQKVEPSMYDTLVRILTKVCGRVLKRIRDDEAHRVHMLYHAQGLYLKDQAPLTPPFQRHSTQSPSPAAMPIEDHV